MSGVKHDVGDDGGGLGETTMVSTASQAGTQMEEAIQRLTSIIDQTESTNTVCDTVLR